MKPINEVFRQTERIKVYRGYRIVVAKLGVKWTGVVYDLQNAVLTTEDEGGRPSRR
jgi:hypothetical protein